MAAAFNGDLLCSPAHGSCKQPLASKSLKGFTCNIPLKNPGKVSKGLAWRPNTNETGFRNRSLHSDQQRSKPGDYATLHKLKRGKKL